MNRQSEAPIPRLQMRAIGKYFGSSAVLDAVDLEVFPGEVHAIVGENGAGKSTLMKILSGALQPDCGEMRLDGLTYRPSDPHQARALGVGMIYQELALAPHLSVEENILLGMEPVRWGLLRRKELRRQAQEILERLGHPEIQPETTVSTLSVGARQLVEIGRALLSGCRVLILDEPTSSLSRPDVERLFSLVREFKTGGMSVLYISHFLEEVRQIADHVTVLRDGKVSGKGSADAFTASQIVAMMVGCEVRELYPKSQRQSSELILEVRQLQGPKGAPVSLQLRRGEVLGIFGLVGAGRTEFLRTVFGLEPALRGEVKNWGRGIGMVSENRKEEGLAQNLSVTDNLTLPHLKKFGCCGWIFKKRQRATVEHWVENLKIRCSSPEQPIGELSGGNQQKVALARLLAGDVEVWLLDEPTKGIDVASKARIYEIVAAAASAAKGVLLVSSYIPELLGCCDRIAVMRQGRLGAARAAGDWTEQELMLEAMGRGAA